MAESVIVVGEGITLTVIVTGVVVVSPLAENSSERCCEVCFPIIIFSACRSFA